MNRKSQKHPNPPPLSMDERVHYRDRLRAARYAALADAEGFGEVCFAIEALGLRLRGEEASMGAYFVDIQPLSAESVTFSQLANSFPSYFTRFEALYASVKRARNDAMHTGVYARHATTAAIELCIGLEEALMNQGVHSAHTVADLMVKSPVAVEKWQPVAYARQLMLMHSFSFLPVFMDKWLLVSETALARYVHKRHTRKESLAKPIEEAAKQGLTLIAAKLVKEKDDVSEMLGRLSAESGPILWLVTDDHSRLVGVLSPYELM